MLKKLVLLKKKIISFFSGSSKFDKHIQLLYEEENYLDAYSEHTDIRVEQDPHQAIGGMWDEIGRLQFEFMSNNGLQPYHTMLDIGCGTLRGGRHFIKYLNAGHYFGMDISPKAIEFGEKLVEKEELSDKRPQLFVNLAKNLKFEELTGKKFDFLLAQSVFTHLEHAHIEECFEYVHRIMNNNSVFFFTFNDASKFKQTGLKDFRYPFSFFQALAEEYDFILQNRSSNYPHPKRQKMLSISKQKAADSRGGRDFNE